MQFTAACEWCEAIAAVRNAMTAAVTFLSTAGQFAAITASSSGFDGSPQIAQNATTAHRLSRKAARSMMNIFSGRGCDIGLEIHFRCAATAGSKYAAGTRIAAQDAIESIADVWRRPECDATSHVEGLEPG